MKLVILDRDGVINQDSPDYIRRPEDWHALPGSVEAIALLCQAGYRIVIATNQSGLGRGLFSIEQLIAIHQKMLRAISVAGGHVDGIFYCPHTPDAACNCRKPNPGLLIDIAKRYQQPLDDIPFIGDNLRDIQAAKAVNARGLLVKTGYGEKTAVDPDLPDNTPVYDNLYAAVCDVLKV